MKSFFLILLCLFPFYSCHHFVGDRYDDAIIIKGKIEVQSRYLSDSVTKTTSLLRFQVFDATFGEPATAFRVRITNADSSVHISQLVEGASFQSEVPVGNYNVIVSLGYSPKNLINLNTESQEIIYIYSEIGGIGLY